MARFAPFLFVFLWSTGFIGAKFGLPHAAPLAFLTVRYLLVLALMIPLAVISRAPWPRDARALSFDERVALQKRLTAAGFDTGGIDAKMGPKTVAAIKGFQKSRGMVPDGFPSLSVLSALP